MRCAVFTWLLAAFSVAGVTRNIKTDYGAAGDGVTQDQAAFVTACTNMSALGGGTLIIPNGTYILNRTTGWTSAVRLTALTNITFSGESRDGAILKQTTAGLYGASSDAHMIQLIRCTNFSFLNLTFDGSKLSYGYHDEQMHGLYLLNATGTTVSNVVFKLLRGDGIFLMGDDTLSCPTPPCFTDGVIVRNCFFYDNGRSGMANQGGLKFITYEDNLFERTSDQDIDFEPTGTRPGPTDVLVRNNVMIHTNSTFSLTLGGTESNPSERFVVSNNFIGGKVMLFRTLGMEFVSNIVILDDVFVDRAVTIQTTISNLLFARNYVQGNGDFVVYAHGDTLNGLVISNNFVRQNGTGRGIRIEGINDRLSIESNRIVGLTNSLEGISLAILTADAVVRTNYAILNNRIWNYGLAIRVGTSTNSTPYQDFNLSYNTWFKPPPINPIIALFKNANDDDAPPEEIIVSPTLFCNRCLPYAP